MHPVANPHALPIRSSQRWPDRVKHLLNDIVSAKHTAKQMSLLCTELKESDAASACLVDALLRHGLDYNAMKLMAILNRPIEDSFHAFVSVSLYTELKN